MNQYSVGQGIALTKASLQRLLARLGIDMPVPALSSECISLTTLQDVLRQSAQNSRTHSLMLYHAHLEQHQPNLTQPKRMKAMSAAETLACADATLAALEGEPSIAMVAQQWQREELKTPIDALQEARQDYLSGNHSSALRKAESSVQKLTTTLHSAYNRLAEAHRAVLSESVSGALSDLGYTIDMASGENRIACWAHKWGNGMYGQGLLSETTVAVVIREDGRLAVDMSGFEGGECEIEMQRFFGKLRERGIQMKREEVFPHLRKDGGQLISSANGKEARDLLKADSRSRSSVSGTVSSKRRKNKDNGSRYRAASAWLWMQQKG